MLKLKQAEVALADGRLEEALELLRQPGVRSHRGGQLLLTRLGEALLERAGAHLEAGEASAAVADCDRAAGVVGNDPRVGALRRRAVEAVAGAQRRRERRAMVARQAQEQLGQGHLGLAEAALAGASGHGSTLGPVVREIDRRRAMLRAEFDAADAALRRDDLDGAARALRRAKLIDENDVELAERVRDVVEVIERQATAAVESGRVDVGSMLVHQLRKLSPGRVEVKQLSRAMRWVREAGACVGRGRYRQAVEALLRVKGQFGSAEWIGEVVEQLRRADAAVEAVRTGPLGRVQGSGFRVQVEDSGLEDGRSPGPSRDTSNVQRPAFNVQGKYLNSEPRTLNPSFVLQVDACGSFLVVCSSRVTFGPVSGVERADVGLWADAATAVVAIERVGDDYFLRAERAVMVNDRSVTRKLLSSGDRIAPSPRCRFAFSVPNAASTTAVVDLVGARTPRADVRRVILLDRELIIGPGAGAHVRVDSMPQPMVLQWQDGRLVRRCGGKVEAIGVGQRVERGDVAFVVVAA